ncbi:hypothetical protein CRG98_007646 [Punica granatum]|uniref:DUF7745 domain-containing protein n=1 Tax=Punica granatum TaxID=22663 RepID=A0A2I0KUE8_PUNGR|nr:hypothetical protein CRG98_007646 [Punica granatum]
MSHSASFLRLDRITPPLEQISHIWTSLRQIDRNYITSFVGDVPMLSTSRVDWNFLGTAVTFWDPTHPVFNIQGTELTPMIEEYRTLIGRTAISHGIVEPNLRTTRLFLVSRLLRVHRSQLHAELAYSGGTGYAIDRIDAALASVIFQVVGGCRYEVVLVAETIRSLNRVTRTADRRLRGSPILLQIWVQSHASPFGLMRPVLVFNHSKSIISRLLPLVHVEERKVSEWIKIFREVSPKGFKWRAAWMPPGPMALRCHDFNGIPLLSHAGSTTYFPSRVMRQFGSLQTVPEDTARTRFEHTWREDQTSVDCQSDIQQVVEKDEQLIDQRQLQRKLQRELSQARAELQRRDQELARANATLERSKKRTHGGPHPS